MALYCTKNWTRVPLTAVSVKTNISGYLAEVTCSLKYENKTLTPVDSVFVFPMGDTCAVYHMEVEVDGRRLVAECQEKQQARETFEDAVEAGHTAYLVEESTSSRDLFKCSIGNLPAQSMASVRLRFAMELSHEGENIGRFTLPRVLKPRYSPVKTDRYTMSPARIVFSTLTATEYAFDFGATISKGSPIKTVTSHESEISWKPNTSSTSGEVLVSGVCDDREMSFDVCYEQTEALTVLVEKGCPDKGGFLKTDALMINFIPQLEEKCTSKHEFIFLIDRSGSMAWGLIESASEALCICLKSLPVGCCFNIIGFGSSFTVLFSSGSVSYTKENLETALQYQKKLNADMGGTEILKPLNDIFNRDHIDGFFRNVFVLTDGSVDNTQEVLALVKANSHSTRVFAVGIGSGASTTLVNGLANAGNGAAEFVLSVSDTIQAKMVKLLKTSQHKYVDNVTMSVQADSQELPLYTLPNPLPRAMQGIQYSAYAVVDQIPTAQNLTVTLKGQVGTDHYEKSVKVCLDETFTDTDGLPIHRMAAKAEIRQLELKLTDRENIEDKSKVIMISLSANLTSRFTSFIAVDKRTNTNIKRDEIKMVKLLKTSQHSHAVCHSMPLLAASQELPHFTLSNPLPRTMQGIHNSPQAMMVKLLKTSQHSHAVCHSQSLQVASQELPHFTLSSPLPRTMQGIHNSAHAMAFESDWLGACPPTELSSNLSQAMTPRMSKASLSNEQFDVDKHTISETGSPKRLRSGLPPPIPRAAFESDWLGACPPTELSSNLSQAMTPRMSKASLSNEQFDVDKHTISETGSPKRLRSGLPPPIPRAVPREMTLPTPFGYLPTCSSLTPEKLGLAIGVKGNGARSTMLTVIEKQELDGHWQLGEIRTCLKHIEDEWQTITDGGNKQDDDVWATAVALSFLQVRFAEYYNEWELVAQKARGWLQFQDLKGSSVDNLLKRATKLIPASMKN